MARDRRYSDYAHRIDIDAFEEAIEFAGEDDGKGNDVGHCPDPWNLHKHGDTTGKFAIHRDKRVFNCWVCGGGTLLSLGMAVWNLQEEDAIDRLLAMCGEPTDERFEAEIGDLLRDERQRDPVVPWFNEKVLDQFEMNFGDEELEQFLLDRHISDEVAKRHRVGFDPTAVKISKSGERYEGMGVVFPHFWRGRLVGWQIRWLKNTPKWVGKYKNTMDMPKKWTIYNYESLYLEQNPIVVVESVPTALFLETLGFPSMATFGGSITPEQLQLLRACQQGLILAPDNDEPGMKFIEKSVPYLERYIDVKVCAPVGDEGSGNDLGDLDDPKDAIQVISEAVDLSLL